MFKSNKSVVSAFTLVELMVVVSIIVILTGIAISAGSAARASARDNQRITDLQTIRLKLEAYRDDKGAYPINLAVLVTGNYFKALPKDPSGNDYLYAGLAFGGANPANCVTYHLGAQFETNNAVLSKRANKTPVPSAPPSYAYCSSGGTSSSGGPDATVNSKVYDVLSPDLTP